MNNPDDDALWDYMEGLLRPREHAIIAKRIQEEPALERRLEELRVVHQLIDLASPPLDIDKSIERVVSGIRKKLQNPKNPETDT